MTSPRIALVVHRFPVLSETFIASKFLGLLERGWDVHVVCDRSDAASWKLFPQLAPELAARVHVNPALDSPWRAAAAVPAMVADALRAPARAAGLLADGVRHGGARGAARSWLGGGRLLSLAPALVHFEFGTLGRRGVELKDRLGCKVVVSFRGYDLNFVGLEEPDYYRPVWDQADAIHALGGDLWARALRRGCPPDMPHALIPPAIDAEHFTPARAHADAAGTAARPLRIASVARLDWKKGYEHALAAIAILRDRGVRCEYRIVGGGPHLEAIAYARHQLGLEEQVQLCGSLPPAEIRTTLEAADVFLHAAVSEGFCNAVIEAQAMELPVVTSDADGLAENVAHGETGFVVPRRDPVQLADRLQQLAGDPQLRRRMGRAGRARVLQRFRIQDQIEAFDRLYRRVLGLGA